MAASPNNTLNLLEQDDTHPMLQLIKADNVMGSGGSLQLQAMNEEPIPEDKRLKIAQHGVEVATGHYGVRLTTAPGDGLYVNYGLNKLDIHANKELVLAEREGDRQSAADMSAQIIGEGHLVIDTAGQVSLSNGNNNYSGDTRINKGVLRTDANDALGKTANLSISNLAQLNLNATAQTVRTFSGQSGSLTLFNHRLHDRLGEPQYTDVFRNEGDFASSLWLRQVGGHERSTSGHDQLKTQSNRYVVQLGGDLAQWNGNSQDRWHLGIMGGYANEHSNTRNERVGYRSDGRIDGYSVGMYGTWYQNDADKVGAYVDSWVLYNWFNNTVESDHRQGDSYRSRGFTASVETGYTFLIGEFTGSEGTLNSGYVQPQVQVTWMGVKEGNHTRSDGTYIETEGDGNVQTRLGVRTYLNSYHRRDAGKQREFQPYIEANYLYNSEVYAVKMNGTKISREGSRHLAELRTGVEAKLNNNLAMWGNVGVQIGDKGYSDTQGMLGVKYSW
ncbi:autotransporter outer membrane beta-barrel domain-containing protein [Escherichia albertii]|nr:autotransporter outer membrane beta-barrel domain-containing protein [Escherichia albertii]